MKSQTITTPSTPKLSARPSVRGQSAAEKNRPISSKSNPAPESRPGLEAGSGQQSANSRKEIVFRLEAPSARNVALAADFTDWEKAPVGMSKGHDGIWQARVSLAQGRHHYKFLVDGRWQEDPKCLNPVPNQFGTSNAVIEVR